MKKRLQKSLSHDWIPEGRAYSFRLRENYVQLNWRRKKREAVGVETVTLTGLLHLIKEKLNDAERIGNPGQNVIIEGN